MLYIVRCVKAVAAKTFTSETANLRKTAQRIRKLCKNVNNKTFKLFSLHKKCKIV